MLDRDLTDTEPGMLRCHAGEPDLSELLRDPMTLALMAADGVDRQLFDALVDRARGSLRRHPAR
jgi:hypothetical protein